jgi:Fe-Mn family superoxide dismutase
MNGMTPAMALALCASFGSQPLWRAQARAQARAAVPATRWLLLAFSPDLGLLLHRPSNDADPLADPDVLLALPTAAAEVDAAIDAIDWTEPYARYQAAAHAASGGCATDAQGLAGATLLDVRRAGVYAASPHVLPGAAWRDPAHVADWAGDLPPGQPVVVYCVYGHEVGRTTALRLRAAGVDARYLAGGIDAWAAAGRPLAQRPEGDP